MIHRQVPDGTAKPCRVLMQRTATSGRAPARAIATSQGASPPAVFPETKKTSPNATAEPAASPTGQMWGVARLSVSSPLQLLAATATTPTTINANPAAVA